MKKTALVLTIVMSLASVCASIASADVNADANTSGAVTTELEVPVKPELPAFELPAGTTMTSEINLTQQDVLVLLKQSITSFAKGVIGSDGHISEMAKAFDLNDIASSLQGITALRLVQFSLNEGTSLDETLSSLEMQFPQSRGWSRMLYSAKDPNNRIIEVFSLNGESFAGIMVNAKRNKNMVLTTAGFLDIPKLAGWAGNIVGGFTFEPPAEAQPAAVESSSEASQQGDDKATATSH